MGIPKNITIREDQKEWIEKEHFKLSPWVRERLDELIKERQKTAG